MSTGAEFVDLGSEKRLLGRTDFDERFMAHLRTLIHESYERAYRTGVVFDTAIGLAADGADKFQLTGTSDATDGLGHELDAVTGGFSTLVQFENTNAVVYQIALHYAEVPSDIQVNPRTGLPEYIGTLEQIGESGDPDSVADNGTNMTFVVDGVTEAGVSNAGRTVRVFRKIPGRNATTMLIAVEDATVVWTGGQNEITTSGDLGQDVISTTASDYTVVLLGVTVKRNTALLNVDGYTFIGKVTGAGAGNPPTVFDITDQDVITASLSDLSDITSRNATTDRLKIDVKSYAGDVSDPQIAVRDPGGSIVYSVDGDGNVVIQGTTTQYDFVQVNASETITDNLTAGDVSGDSHLITGTWTHQPQGGGTAYFVVDGTTGRIGMGIAPDPADRFTVLDEIRVEGAANPALHVRNSTVAADSGGLWRWVVDGVGDFSVSRSSSGGDFTTATTFLILDFSLSQVVSRRTVSPFSNDTVDIGTASAIWRTGYINELILGTAAGDGIGSDLLPDVTLIRDLGSTTRQYAETHTRDLYLGAGAGEGVHTHLLPDTTSTWDLGSVSARWNNLFVINLSFTGHFLPTVDNTQDLGSASLEWRNLYIDGTANIDAISLGTSAGEGLGSDMVPSANNVRTLGSPSHRFKNIHSNILTLDAASTSGVDSNLSPTLFDTYNIGSLVRRWSTAYIGTLNSTGHLIPVVNATQDIGSASLRWANLRSKHVDIGFGGPATTALLGSIQNPIEDTALINATSIGLLLNAYWDNSSNTGSRTGLDCRATVTGHSLDSSPLIGAYIASINTSITAGFGSQFGTSILVRNDTPYATSGMSDAYGTHIDFGGAGLFTDNLYGLYIENVTRGNNNYAIKTNDGIVSFGDVVQPDQSNVFNLGTTSLLWARVFHGKPWAHIYATGTQVNTSTWAFVAGGNNVSGSDVTVSATNFQFTINKAGVYRISYGMPLGLFGTSGNVVQTVVTVGGTQQNQSYTRCGVSSTGGKNACTASTLLDLSVSDVVRLQIQERTSADSPPGAFSTMGDTAANSTARRWMAIELVRYT